MGTRADFYIGKGPSAEWLGSICWDGDEIAGYIRAAKREQDYRKAVEVFLASRKDAILPDRGWPWPWDDSSVTDRSYWFFDGQCWSEMLDHFWPADQDTGEDDDVSKREPVVFPDMSSKRIVGKKHDAGFITIKG